MTMLLADEEETQAGVLTAQSGHLSRDQFVQAAQTYAYQTAPTDDDNLSSANASGWQWAQGANPPFTQHLQRTMLFPATLLSASIYTDAALLDSMGLDEDETFVEQPCQNGDAAAMLRVQQTVCYSSTWRVPVLYLEATYAESGAPVPIDLLCGSNLFARPNADRVQSDAGQSEQAVFPTISIGENAATGHASAYLHPCQTAVSIASTLLSEGRTDFDGLAYIKTFVMLCSTVVKMRARPFGTTHSTMS